MFSTPRTLKLEGQSFIFNDDSKTVVIEITQPFMNAEKHFESDIHLCKDHNPELNEIPDEVILKSKLFGKERFN